MKPRKHKFNLEAYLPMSKVDTAIAKFCGQTKLHIIDAIQCDVFVRKMPLDTLINIVDDKINENISEY